MERKEQYIFFEKLNRPEYEYHLSEEGKTLSKKKINKHRIKDETISRPGLYLKHKEVKEKKKADVSRSELFKTLEQRQKSKLGTIYSITDNDIRKGRDILGMMIPDRASAVKAIAGGQTPVSVVPQSQRIIEPGDIIFQRPDF